VWWRWCRTRLTRTVTAPIRTSSARGVVTTSLLTINPADTPVMTLVITAIISAVSRNVCHHDREPPLFCHAPPRASCVDATT